MARLSFVVPVHDVGAYLDECLGSILADPSPAIEAIAVDDASTDGSAGILAAWADRDPRLQVISLTGNVGQAEARNLGLDRASGDHVWFVDGDDAIVPEAVEQVLHVLDADRLDVLVLDFGVLLPDGTIEPRPGIHHPLGAPDLRIVPADRRRELFGVSPYVWNKVIRRELLLDQGLRFEGRWYEDQRLVAQLLLVADRFGVLQRDAYRYRRRAGSATRSESDQHFESIEQWAGVFAFFDARPDLEPLRAPLVARMVRSHQWVLREEHRLPPDRRADYYREAGRMYRSHRARRADPPATDRLERLALRLGSYRLHGANRRLRSVARRARARLSSGR